MSSYDPEIDAALEFFRAKLDALQQPRVVSKDMGGSKRDIFTI
jgi:hypothetical protein